MNKETQITASAVVGEDKRLEFLSKHFGVRFARRGEALVFAWLLRLAKVPIEWTRLQYYTLSNSGFYLAPRELRISECELSADAVGIVATMLTLRQLAHESAACVEADSTYPAAKLAVTASVKFAQQYHHLAAYSVKHAESINIYRAID
ncbi:antirestriction protein (plasmid) [Xanthomonas albilineans]|uniref:Probable antirestriction protein klca n=1 Tax=Xanthomonas albilineans (strain GPE PC73 / CFBP 7063) TaxID=380358 RepID=D6CK84_XANAP|nr:antirestriction protein [Xanthomonas albilineans]CAZ15873.1 probable antirestriction protein klca [Xanthomonas albilineans]